MPWSEWITPDPDDYSLTGHSSQAPYKTRTDTGTVDTEPLVASAWAAVDGLSLIPQSVAYAEWSASASATEVALEATVVRRPVHTSTFSAASHLNQFVWDPAAIPQMAELTAGVDYDVIPDRDPGADNAYVDYEDTTTTIVGWSGVLDVLVEVLATVESEDHAGRAWPTPPAGVSYTVAVNGVTVGTFSYTATLESNPDLPLIVVTDDTDSANHRAPTFTGQAAGSTTAAISLHLDKPSGLVGPSMTLIEAGAAHQEGHYSQLAWFQSPAVTVRFQRPRLRYWLPEGVAPPESVTPALAGDLLSTGARFS